MFSYFFILTTLRKVDICLSYVRNEATEAPEHTEAVRPPSHADRWYLGSFHRLCLA